MTTHKKQRRPRPETWPEAIQIITIAGKLWNREPLTSAERRLAVSALQTYVSDEQNGRYWQSVTHRPADQGRAFHCVLDIVIDVARDVEEAAAKGAASIRWQLSANQIKHALKNHRKHCEELIAGKDLAAWRRMNDWHRARLAGKK